MMRRTIFYLVLVLFFCMGGMQGCSKTIPIQEEDKDEVVIEETTHGVCRMNLQRESYGKVVEIANNIVQSSIPVVRINGIKEGGSIDQVIHNINTFAQKGVKVLLMQSMWIEMYPEGYEQVSGPSRMSDIDPDRFRIFMNKLLEELALHTQKDAIIGLELFNEANHADFNGDLQPTPEGKGEIFKLDTPLDKPSFQDAYAGITKYSKCLEITKSLMDVHFTERNVKLITQGMKSGGEQNDFRWAINNGYTVVAADMFITLLQGKHPDQADKTNYLQFADGIGFHAYPELFEDMEGSLLTYYYDIINNVLDERMPYWITEWGFRKELFENNGGEARRLQYFRRFIQAVEKIGNTEMTLLFDFDLNKNHCIWENGALLESGKIFQEINN